MHKELELQSYVRYMLEGGNATGFKILYYLSRKEKTNLSHRELAKEIGVSATSAYMELKRLAKLGYITAKQKEIAINS
jgi:Mn-dependent DtxR family transcriptional regulator